MNKLEFDVTFSINEYDRDGDCNEEAIFLHIGDHVRLRVKNIEELTEFRDNINSIIEEIKSYG